MSTKEVAAQIVSILESVLKALVDYPDEVTVSVEGSDRTVVFVVNTTRNEDRGKLIGREGRTAQAIRVLVSNICAKYQIKAIVEILEDRRLS
jgi:predicted RNA-binding protein YlqC (UPF0109 family)